MSPPSDRLHVFFPVVQPACVCLRSRSGLASGLVLTEAGGCLRWISSSSKVEVWGDLVILVRADSSTLTPCELMACFVPRAVRRRQQCDLPAFVEHFCIFILFFLKYSTALCYEAGDTARHPVGLTRCASYLSVSLWKFTLLLSNVEEILSRLYSGTLSCFICRTCFI